MLDIDGATIIWEIINFLIIAVALNFLLFKPVVKKAEEQRIEKERLHAEMVRDRDEAATKLAAINTRLENFEDELETIADEMYDRGKQVQTELMDGIKSQAAVVIREEAMEARYEHLAETKTKQTELVDAIMNVTGSTLKKVLPATTQGDLVSELVKRVWDLGKSDMAQVYAVRESLKDQEAVIRITAAQPLTIEEQSSLVRTFSALADQDVILEIELDPSLISGVKVRIGDLILEHSVQKQLLGVREDIVRTVEGMFIDDENADG